MTSMSRVTFPFGTPESRFLIILEVLVLSSFWFTGDSCESRARVLRSGNVFVRVNLSSFRPSLLLSGYGHLNIPYEYLLLL